MARAGVFSLLIFALSSAPSFAAKLTKAECPATDFSPQLGLPVHQGDTNMCHAFVAADLITINQGIGPKHKVSALDVASNMTVTDFDAAYGALPPPTGVKEFVGRERGREFAKKVQSYLFDWKTDMRGGLPDLDVVAYNMRPSICTEADLPSVQSVAFNGGRDYLFERVKKSTGNWDKNFVNWSILQDCGVKAAFAAEDFADFAMKLGRLLQRESDTTLRKDCRNPLPLRKMNAHKEDVPEGVAARKAIELFRQGIPMGFGYDPSALSGGIADRASSDHASSAVGSRWNEKKKQCEIRVRNTKGPDCKRYRKDWDCEQGDLWVPSENFDQMVTSVFYIDKQIR